MLRHQSFCAGVRVTPKASFKGPISVVVNGVRTSHVSRLSIGRRGFLVIAAGCIVSVEGAGKARANRFRSSFHRRLRVFLSRKAAIQRVSGIVGRNLSYRSFFNFLNRRNGRFLNGEVATRVGMFRVSVIFDLLCVLGRVFGLTTATLRRDRAVADHGECLFFFRGANGRKVDERMGVNYIHFDLAGGFFRALSFN